LFRGKQFDYDGKHYHLKLTQVDEMHYPPRPFQQPRIPLWTVGVWPREKSILRTLKGDGILPAKINAAGEFEPLQPQDVAELKSFIQAHRDSPAPFDIVVEGNTSGFEPAKIQDTLAPWAEAGATWWIEGLWTAPRENIEARIRQGPPRLAA
jgi:alkanesulfonate monooxygenase SsuD/methylene tetrahydromethanopterin reductase-like flavin-dependent oxidoreductase (luciferase family)